VVQPIAVVRVPSGVLLCALMLVVGSPVCGSSVLGRSVAAVCHVECVHRSRSSFILMVLDFILTLQHSLCGIILLFLCGTRLCIF
jgi:hypothetical protein